MIIARPRLGVLPVGMTSRDSAASAFTESNVPTSSGSATSGSPTSAWDLPVTMQMPTTPTGRSGSLFPTTGWASVPGTAQNAEAIRQLKLKSAQATAIKRRQDAVWAAEDAASHARNAKRSGADRNLLATTLDFVSKAREAATRACAAAADVTDQASQFPEDSTLSWALRDAQGACSEASKSAREAQAAADQSPPEPEIKDIRIQPAPVAGKFPVGLVAIGGAALLAILFFTRRP